MRRWLTTGCGVGAALALTLIGTSPSAVHADGSAPGLNDNVVLWDDDRPAAVVRVTDVRWTDQTVVNDPESGVVLLRLEVINPTDRNLHFDDDAVLIADDDGDRYRPNRELDDLDDLDDYRPLPESALKSGGTYKGWLRYGVPRDTELTQVVFVQNDDDDDQSGVRGQDDDLPVQNFSGDDDGRGDDGGRDDDGGVALATGLKIAYDDDDDGAARSDDDGGDDDGGSSTGGQGDDDDGSGSTGGSGGGDDDGWSDDGAGDDDGWSDDGGAGGGGGGDDDWGGDDGWDDDGGGDDWGDDDDGGGDDDGGDDD